MSTGGRLVAPGVPRELMDEMLQTEGGPSASASASASSRSSLPSLLAPVNAWSPPAAYGGLHERPGKAGKAQRESGTSGGRKGVAGQQPGPGGGQVVVTAENFLSFTQLPFQPAEAPQRVATASKFRLDRKLRYAVSARTPPCVGTLGVSGEEDLRCVALSPDAGNFLVATDAGTSVWSAATPQSSNMMEPEHRVWNELFFGAQPQSQTQLYQVPGASVVQISQQPPPVAVTGHTGAASAGVFKPLNLRGVLGAAFAPDAPLLLTVGMHGQVTLTATDSLLNLASYSGHASRVPVWSVEWSPAGTYFATGAGDGCARLWRTDIVAPLRVFQNPSSSSSSAGRHLQNVAWHPNCQLLAAASEAEVVLWDVLAATPVQSFPRTGVNDICFSPNGNLLTIASDAGVEVLDVGENKTLMMDDTESVMNVAWSWPTAPPSGDKPGGASLVTVGTEGKCRLYEKIGNHNAPICELPLERNIRPFKAQFTGKNFLVVAGADLGEKLDLV